MNAFDSIKKAMKDNNLIIGYNRSIKALKTSKAELIILANNTPARILSEVKSAAKVANIPIEVIDKSNVELGATCKKPFSVSIVSVLREKK